MRLDGMQKMLQLHLVQLPEPAGSLTEQNYTDKLAVAQLVVAPKASRCTWEAL